MKLDPWSSNSSLIQERRGARNWSVVALSAPLALLLGLTLLLGLAAVLAEFNNGFWSFGLLVLGWTMVPIVGSLVSFFRSRRRKREQAVMRFQIVALFLCVPALLGLSGLYFLAVGAAL